jgi:hypothetical protein
VASLLCTEPLSASGHGGLIVSQRTIRFGLALLFSNGRLLDVLFSFYSASVWIRQRRIGDWYALGAACAVRCDHCGHTGRTTSEALRERFGPTAVVRDVGRKMRCSECGKRGAKIAPLPS